MPYEMPLVLPLRGGVLAAKRVRVGVDTVPGTAGYSVKPYQLHADHASSASGSDLPSGGGTHKQC